MSKLAIFHISDLHFGDRGDTSKTPWLQGAAGHDYSIVRALDAAIRKLCLKDYANHEKLIVVSGDLTAIGTRAEFHQALTFLHGQFVINFNGFYPQSIGFGDLIANGTLHPPLVIPGNHDHWNGGIFPLRHAAQPTPINANIYNYAIPSDQSTSPWWWGETYNVGAKDRVLFVGMESNHKQANWTSLATRFACGHIEAAAFKEVDDWLDQKKSSLLSGQKATIVLTVHHSIARQTWSHGLSKSSITALETLCNKHKVAAVLTGHAHSVLLGNSFYQPNKDVPNGQFTELRCGSTTQARLHHNMTRRTFLVHELDFHGRIWTTEVFAYDDVHSPPSNTFTKLPSTLHSGLPFVQKLPS